VGVVGGVVVGRRFIAPTPAAVSGGGAPEPGAPPASSPEIELQALRAVVARDDAPIPTLLQFAHLSLDLGRLGDARRTYDRVLARDPRNAEAITHVGAVLYAEGKVDEALGKVEEALRIDPQYVHALWDRVQYQLRGKRDFAATVKAGEAFLAVVPSGPDADNIRKMMAEARQQAGK
jgi:tetratricopeptide (TPR) repeat protein